MIDAGLSEAEAFRRFYLVDRDGLLVEGMSGLQSFQMPFAQRRDRLCDWKLEKPTRVSLTDVMNNAHPTALIGTSGQPNAFTERIVRDMARHVRQPIIFPLSNPTERSEATPTELDSWTEGRAVIGTGSPFPPLKRNGKVFRADQTNNAYVYPGIGLGAIATGSRRISDGMFLAAAHAIAEKSPAIHDSGANLLPPLRQIRELTFQVAVAVGKQAQKEGLTRPMSDEAVAAAIRAKMWEPRYPSYTRVEK
jgi:malate dehydrogenase (oxaloacetate-decarboxylating)